MSKTKFLERFENTGLNVPDHVWHKAIDHDIRASTGRDIFLSPKLSSDQITIGLNDNDWMTRSFAARNPNIKSNQLDGLLIDSDDWIRRGAAMNPSCTKEHLVRALNDNSSLVRDAARDNPRYKEILSKQTLKYE